MVMGVAAPQFPFGPYEQEQENTLPKAVAGKHLNEMADLIPQMIQLYQKQQAMTKLGKLLNSPQQLAPGVQGPNQQGAVGSGDIISTMMNAGMDPSALIGNMFPNQLQASTINKNNAMASWLGRRPATTPAKPFNPASAAAVDVNVQKANAANRSWLDKLLGRGGKIVNPLNPQPQFAPADDLTVANFIVTEGQ